MIKWGWVEELSYVLWSYRMTIHFNTKETPFKLKFGQDIIILIEVEHPSSHVSNYSKDVNDWLRVKNLNFLEEGKEMAYIWLLAYKEKIRKYFDKQVQSKDFHEWDVVLRRANSPKKETSEGKISMN